MATRKRWTDDAERLRLLQQSITQHFGEQDCLSGGEAGLHLALGLPDHCDDAAISRQAKSEGIIVRPLSRYYMNPVTARRGLMLGYACVPDAQIRPTFDKLARIILQHWPEGHPVPSSK